MHSYSSKVRLNVGGKRKRERQRERDRERDRERETDIEREKKKEIERENERERVREREREREEERERERDIEREKEIALLRDRTPTNQLTDCDYFLVVSCSFLVVSCLFRTQVGHNYILNVHKVGLYSTRFLIDRVRVLLLNKFLY
jgi:hypothetical protein